MRAAHLKEIDRREALRGSAGPGGYNIRTFDIFTWRPITQSYNVPTPGKYVLVHRAEIIIDRWKAVFKNIV